MEEAILAHYLRRIISLYLTFSVWVKTSITNCRETGVSGYVNSEQQSDYNQIRRFSIIFSLTDQNKYCTM